MHGEHRKFSFDNLRTLMVLFIVLLHAVCAYAASIPWWHAQDAKGMVYDIALISIDNFALPVLFFVSGLFAAPSLDRHGTSGFIKGKLKRLGLPLLFLPTFYLPTMVYMGYLRRVEHPADFFSYWLHWMKTALDWKYVAITSMETGARYADAFTPHHLWFISLLLIFFLGYAGWRALSPEMTDRLSLAAITATAGTLIFIGFAIGNLLIQDWAWVRFGPFLLFQPTRLPVYLGMFIFGIFARPYMPGKHPFPWPTWLWFLIFLLAQGGMIVMSRQFMLTAGPAPLGDALIHGLLRAVLSVSAVCMFVNLTCRFMAGPSSWRESLSASSYDIYLLHMPLTVFVQTLLLSMAIPLSLKMLAAFAVPTFLLWWLSRFMAPRNAAVPAGLLTAYFIGFCLFA